MTGGEIQNPVSDIMLNRFGIVWGSLLLFFLGSDVWLLWASVSVCIVAQGHLMAFKRETVVNSDIVVCIIADVVMCEIAYRFCPTNAQMRNT